ncbi:MAG TPA: lipopolysaccharide kinase InaA family protein [Syntrophorhabdaceae bacterium]|jgi:tRNA A-37 threonylcarbamoyl transferase component Bud32|nr:hypothetical protein [Syntrophorhabdaceae bacterium]HOB68411.1 lipopolysaccharide kinase InaA family protein [Syntrophorhabdaceae bacterium]HOG39038.1 lipopolysaccharide kinase InaA family protein [Syntrophorhabdaceae bacterium]HPN97216.1 lipopolysaccharide kinase InaA family protein [Syntrophorhabdaceae bacterium]HQM76185.1 lipopolysaccharide kinase InaA family protein [Syntrophorhabdaceae bacterium]
MKHLEIGGIKWFFRDDHFAEFIKGFLPDEYRKRGHFTFEHQNKRAFIKYFREEGVYGFVRNRLQPRGKKEFLLGRKLTSLCIPTPEPLGYGISEGGSYIVQELLEGTTLTDVFEKADDKSKLLIDLARFLKTLKVCHVRHNDLHLNNIIAKNGVLHLVDLHKTQIKKLFTLDDEVSNIAHAITMVYQGMDEDEKTLFFKEYGNEDIKLPVEAELKRLRHRWIDKKKKRAFNNTSIMTVEGDCVYIAGCKDMGRGVLVGTIKEDKKVRVERYSDHIRKTYRDKRRLKRAWKNHIALTYLRLDITPRAFFVRMPSHKERGFIAMEDLSERGEELDRYLDRVYGGLNLHEKRMFIDRLSAFFANTITQWVIHKDVKACNVFVLKGKGFVFLDVEDIVFEEIDEGLLKRMMVQMNTTIPKRISTRDRTRFFLKLTGALKMKKKDVFKDIVSDSLKSVIVYEGAGGLKTENW